MIPWLPPDIPFPDPEQALIEPNGLLAATESLSVERLLNAYQQGIFPWYSSDQPVLWWSPDPRMILVPEQFRYSRSLRQILRKIQHNQMQQHWEARVDSAFVEVIHACANTRSERGTWITPEIIEAYHALHQMGYAHSVEIWIDDQLSGGLYGVAIGRMFYGESMFSRVANTSKIALASLVPFLHVQGCRMIDCQQNTAHLASLGAHEIPRPEFLAQLKLLIAEPAIDWPNQLPIELPHRHNTELPLTLRMFKSEQQNEPS